MDRAITELWVLHREKGRCKCNCVYLEYIQGSNMLF